MKKRIGMLLLTLGILSVAGCGKDPVNELPETIGAEEERESEEKEQEIPEQEEEQEEKIVSPMETLIDLNSLGDGTLAVSVESGAISCDEADTQQWKIKVTVYAQELYDPAKIAALENGSIIEIAKEQVTVSTVETNELGTVILNGGLDAGGYELITNEDGAYYSIGYSDMKTYAAVGETELPLAPEFVYIDASDLDAGETEYTVTELVENAETVLYEGTPNNTTILVENGKVISMTKVYTP